MSELTRAFDFLAGLAPDSRLAVGLSGGMDSTTLLHAATKHLPGGMRLRALHVNHGLHGKAGEWERFCAEICAQLDTPLDVLRVQVPESGASWENRARIARYEAFRQNLRVDEWLLLAHHLDDQTETMLLRLARGAGIRGLGGIPRQRKLGRGMLLRPFLACPKADLARYAREQGLRWIEDDTNRDSRFDRNFCRHEILPLIEQRWPNYRRDWERSRLLIQQSGELLDALARLDCERCAGEAAPALSVKRLRQLGEPRARNALRHWIEQKIEGPANPRKLRGLPDWLIAPRQDVAAAIDFGACSVRRFGGHLHLLPNLAPLDKAARLQWDPSREPLLAIPGNGNLRAIRVTEQGLAANSYEIRYRRGGERCRFVRRPGKTLKKLLNEARVEPWRRERLPLLFRDGELAAVPGLGFSERASARPGYRIEWLDPFGNSY